MNQGIIKAVCAAIGCILAIALIGFCMTDSQEQHAALNSTETGTYMLSVDTSNAAVMHNYGLPTKSDVMQWHVFGQWGYYRGGTLYAFDVLPGDSRQWDLLYHIDSDNPAFDK